MVLPTTGNAVSLPPPLRTLPAIRQQPVSAPWPLLSAKGSHSWAWAFWGFKAFLDVLQTGLFTRSRSLPSCHSHREDPTSP